MVATGRSYATYGTRLLAFLLDQFFGMVVGLLALALLFVPLGLLLATGGGEPSPVAFVGLFVVMGLVWLGSLVAIYWNVGWRQGRTGQSLGKQAMGIEVVRVADGSYLGAGTGVLRALMAGLVSGFFLLGYLWPLWHDREQTWHDLIVDSLVIARR